MKNYKEKEDGYAEYILGESYNLFEYLIKDMIII